MEPTTNPDARKIAVERIIRQLNLLRVDYVIDLGEGDCRQPVDSKLEIKVKRPVTRDGVRSAYVDQFVADMQPGEERVVPPGSYCLKELSGIVSTRAHKHFGAGNYVTATGDTGVVVLCLGLREDEEAEDVA